MPTGGAQAPSYAHGAGAVPLLGETIGANLERTAARVPERRRLVSCHQGVRFTYAELERRGRPRSRAGCWRSASRRATASACGAPTAPSGRSSQYATAKARRDPGQHQPGLPDLRAGVRAAPVGLPRAGRRAGVQGLRLRRRWSTRCARASRARAGRLLRHARVGGAGRGRAGRTRPSCARDGRAGLRRPDQHPVHERAPRASRRAPRSPTTTSSTTRYFVGAGLRLHRGRSGLHPGAALPLLRHGDGEPGCTTARRLHGLSRGGVRRRWRCSRRSQAERCTSLYGVPTMFIAELEHPTSPSFDLVEPAHRHHGRLAVPDRGDEAGRSEMDMRRDDDRLRHDRDVAGVDADPPPTTRSSSAVGTVGRAIRTSRSRSSTRRPARTVPAASPGELLHPRLPGDARLLGRPASAPRRRSTRPAGCTPATWP